MKLCISNIGWDSSIDEYMYKCLKDYGFSGLEIAPTRIFLKHPYECLKEAKDWSARIKAVYGLEIPSIQSIWYGRSERIFASKDERRILLDYTKRVIMFAEAVGAKNIVFGCPINRAGYRKCEEKNRKIAIDFFRELGTYAFYHNTVIGFEANPSIYQTDFVNTTEEAITFVEEINIEGFKLNLDTGTLIYNNEKLDILTDKTEIISHVQVSEPGLNLIKRNPVHRKLSSLLEETGYNRYISIEMRRLDSQKAIQEVMSYVKDVFG